MIVDCHTHRYAPEVLADPQVWAREHGEPHWALLVGPNDRGYHLQGWADGDRFPRDMDAAGVDKVVLMGWYWQNPATCHLQNGWLTEWISEDAARFLAFATFHAGGGEDALRNLERAVDAGAVGVGELSPEAQGYAWDDPYFLRMLGFAEERGLPVNLHVTEPVGRNYAGRVDTSLRAIQRTVELFPDLKLILAHWGGGLFLQELNPFVRKIFRNVYYDTAASPLIYKPAIFRQALEVVGAEKILYGSDYPLKLFPRKSQEPDFGTFLDQVSGAVPGDKDRAAILGGNLERLIAR